MLGISRRKAAAARFRQLSRTCAMLSDISDSARERTLNGIVTNLSRMLQRIIGEDVRLRVALHSAPLWTRADAGMVE